MRFVAALALLGSVSMAWGFSDNRVWDIVGAVEDGNYQRAVDVTMELNSQNRQDLIREAVQDLFLNSKRNLFEFGNTLERSFMGHDVFIETFPVEIQRIIEEKLVRLINKQDYMPLKLSSRTDSDGDRKAYGDSADSVLKTIAWRFTPVWDNNELYFHILGIERNQYLKLASKADSDGDHTAYGGNSPTDHRYQWFLVPMKVGRNNLFYIVNREFKQALKLGRALDYDEDRIAYGHNGIYQRYPDSFAWYLTEY